MEALVQIDNQDTIDNDNQLLTAICVANGISGTDLTPTVLGVSQVATKRLDITVSETSVYSCPITFIVTVTVTHAAVTDATFTQRVSMLNSGDGAAQEFFTGTLTTGTTYTITATFKDDDGNTRGTLQSTTHLITATP